MTLLDVLDSRPFAVVMVGAIAWLLGCYRGARWGYDRGYVAGINWAGDLLADNRRRRRQLEEGKEPRPR